MSFTFRMLVEDEFELAEVEAKNYVFVVLTLDDGREYRLYMVTPIRLYQDSVAEFASGRSFCAAENTVILPEISICAVNRAVRAIMKEGALSMFVGTSILR